MTQIITSEGANFEQDILHFLILWKIKMDKPIFLGGKTATKGFLCKKMERKEPASHWIFELERGKHGANTIGFNGAEKLYTATIYIVKI